ncbi:40S ribosomal protein S29-like [Echinops telfairi]|uniref:40S ribosomal protein S29-like n=1 Tax=Echinops telfairi TaxID=9371 RepID=A0AC55CSQ7_ECHTE|nr:40S ribosomal protein S29-like [Echinops telfairi]
MHQLRAQPVKAPEPAEDENKPELLAHELLGGLAQAQPYGLGQFVVGESGNKVGPQQLSWSSLRKFGPGSHSCHVCSNRHGLIRKYSLTMCRQCFRQYAKDTGFIQLD